MEEKKEEKKKKKKEKEEIKTSVTSFLWPSAQKEKATLYVCIVK